MAAVSVDGVWRDEVHEGLCCVVDGVGEYQEPSGAWPRPTGAVGGGYIPDGFCCGVRIAAAGHGPKVKSRRGRSLDLRRPDYGLQERVELPARLRAQSGRFRAKDSRPGC